jgi:hypothetical protein
MRNGAANVAMQDIHPMPRKVAKARLTLASVASSRRPIRLPSFARGIVVALSTITCDCWRSPVCSLGSTVIRKQRRVVQLAGER